MTRRTVLFVFVAYALVKAWPDVHRTMDAVWWDSVRTLLGTAVVVGVLVTIWRHLRR